MNIEARPARDADLPQPATERQLVSVGAPAEPDEVTLLSQIIATQSEIAAAGLDPHEVVDIVVRRAQELTRSSGAVVELLEDEEMVYWAASGAAEREVGLRLPASSSLSGLCVRTGEVLRCDDSESDPRVNREACRRVGLRSMLVVPLVHRGKTDGVLKVLSPTPGNYGPSDVRTLKLMASLIGSALGHAVEHAAMKEELESHRGRERAEAEGRSATYERIRAVLHGDALTMLYQPVERLSDGEVVGLEALARFRAEPVQSPDRWFEDAERVGLGTELEIAAVRRALEALSETPADLYVAVNVSPATVVSGGLEAAMANVPEHRVVLEITEHAQVPDYDELAEALAPHRNAGARLAIDDAGAGYASLRHILHLEPDVIKLDMSLTRGIDSRPRQQHLATALIAFAAGSGATIVAEGIETQAELETLRALGVPLGQGYLLARPAPLSQSHGALLAARQ